MNLSIGFLRTLVAVVDTGGFTQAARRLGLTQPTVSQQIKKLEQLIERPLVRRGHGPPSLTAEGQTLVEYARRILVLNDEALDRIFQPSVSGKLRLGIPHEFTFSVLPKLVGAFSQIHPGVVIEVDCQLSKKLLDNLDRYDLVIALHKRDKRSTGIRIREEPLVWVSSLDYRLDSTARLNVVAAPKPCIYREVMQSALRRHQPGWSLLLTSTSYGAVCAAVSSGMGITVLAQSVVPDDLRVMEAVELPLQQEVELRLHYDEASASPATINFARFFQSKFDEQVDSLPYRS